MFVASCGGKTEEDAKPASIDEGFVYCPDFSQSLPMTQSLPWGAVGFLNNGCTAVLIDGYHVVAAAHCVVNNGVWQPNLRFYPNYQTPASRPNPPRYGIARAVAGTFSQDGSTGANSGFQASDWAILRLTCSSVRGGGTWCPPVTDFPYLPMAYPGANNGDSVYRGGYDRDATKLSPDAICPPYTDEANSCPLGACPCDWPNTQANWWWQNGFVDPSCVVGSTSGWGTTDHELVTSCSTRGGASGSPVIKNNIYGAQMVGIIHGAGAGTPEDVPCENPAPGQEYLTIGPGVERFAYAPRYASTVALTAHEDGSARTRVYVVDGDESRVRTRYRKSASLSAGWSVWGNLGDPVSGMDRIAATRLTNFKPELVALTTSGTPYLNYVDSVGNWTGWTYWAGPSYPPADVDAALDANGLANIYAAANVSGGWAWRRHRSGMGAYDSWSAWELLISGWVAEAYTRVSSVRRHGDNVQMAFLVTSTGAVRWMREPFPVWTPTDFAAPATIIDIDAGWTADNRAFVIALASTGALWFRDQTATSGDGWNGWTSFSVPMFVPPNCAGGNPLGITSVYASRWQDDPISTVVPVVFATDYQGMLYYTTYETGPCTYAACDCGGTKWQPWKPFYHAKRWADY